MSMMAKALTVADQIVRPVSSDGLIASDLMITLLGLWLYPYQVSRDHIVPNLQRLDRWTEGHKMWITSIVLCILRWLETDRRLRRLWGWLIVLLEHEQYR